MPWLYIYGQIATLQKRHKTESDKTEAKMSKTAESRVVVTEHLLQIVRNEWCMCAYILRICMYVYERGWNAKHIFILCVGGFEGWKGSSTV